MGPVILQGDSIFDNARYVPDRPPVIEQLRRCLPPDWRASLLAVDGHMTEDVANQLTRLPADASHLLGRKELDGIRLYGVVHRHHREVVL